MNQDAIGENDNEDEEFECSECDFKCHNEVEMIEHSVIHENEVEMIEHTVMHQNTNNSVNSLFETLSKADSNENCSVESDISKVGVEELKVIKEIWQLNTSNIADISEIDAKENCSVESDPLEVYVEELNVKKETRQLSTSNISDISELDENRSHNKCSVKRKHDPIIEILSSNITREIMNKRLKLNQPDIENDIHFIDCSGQAENSAGSNFSTPECIKNCELSDSANNSMDTCTDSLIMSSKNTIERTELLKSHNNFSFDGVNSLNILSQDKAQCSRIEIKVDNTGIYIPLGWSRKVFIRTRLLNGNIKCDTLYLTEKGNRIATKSQAYWHCNKNPSSNIDVDELDFSAFGYQKTINSDKMWLEMDIDNSGMYIPNGWERKFNVCTDVKADKKYSITFHSPDKKKIWSKSEMYSLISRSNNIEDKSIDVSKMCFSLTRNTTDSGSGNVDTYIPEGWQWNVNVNTNPNSESFNKSYITYFSPEGNSFSSKSEVYSYLTDSKNLLHSAIDVEKMNFSDTSEAPQSMLEMNIDNNGIYIPDGWHRKLNVSTKYSSELDYSIVYLNQDGKRFWCKRDVFLYLFISEQKNMDLIEVEKMNFSITNFQINTKKCYSKPNESKPMEILLILFDTRKIIQNSHSQTLYLCKLCCNSYKDKRSANRHINKHQQVIHNKITHNNSIPTSYDFFVCITCQVRLTDKKELIDHLSSHSSKQITNNIVDVKIVHMVGKNKIRQVLYCCEVCNFACYGYSESIKHINSHTFAEIDKADRDKYHTKNIDEKATLTDLNDTIADDNVKIVEKKCERIYNKQDTPGPKIYKSDPVKPKKDLVQFSQVLIENANTNKYIPDGWKREVYRYTDGLAEGRYVVKYISPSGKKLFCRKHVLEYIERNELTDEIDVDQMDFTTTLSNKKIEVKNISEKCYKLLNENRKKGGRALSPREEVEVDNTDIYVPEGWQRKMFKILGGPQKGVNKACYISPFGKVVCAKFMVKQHLKLLRKSGTYMRVDVNKMDFTIRGRKEKRESKFKCYPREELEVDNTDIYIPEGWQWKAFKFLGGSRKGEPQVCYISPYDKEIRSRMALLHYLKQLKKRKIVLKVDADKMVFYMNRQEWIKRGVPHPNKT